MSQIKQLSRMFTKLIWWVDPDKQSGYPSLINKASYYFKEVMTVASDNDPKYYTTEELCHYLA